MQEIKNEVAVIVMLVPYSSKSCIGHNFINYCCHHEHLHVHFCQSGLLNFASYAELITQISPRVFHFI